MLVGFHNVWDINDQGQIVGDADGCAALWMPEPAYGLPAGISELSCSVGNARAINASGQVAGWHNGLEGFLWLPEPAYGLPAGMNDLGSLPGHESTYPESTNSHGQIVGRAGGPPERAFLWLPTPAYGLPAGMNDLGDLPGTENHTNWAKDINDLGQVVGWGYAESPLGQHAWLWQNGQMIDLNDVKNRLPGGLGWSTLSRASAINNEMQIAGQGRVPGEGRRVFRLEGLTLCEETQPGVFDCGVVPPRTWIDPAPAYGFKYVMISASLFTAIMDFPLGFASPFTVSVGGSVLGTFGPGESVDFVSLTGGGVASFTVTGITPNVNPHNPIAFPLKIDFDTETANIRMISIITPDADADTDVDPDDLALFEDCATGPDVGPPSSGCEQFDFDEDNDIDQGDFGIFQGCYSGPDVIADPACMESAG